MYSALESEPAPNYSINEWTSARRRDYLAAALLNIGSYDDWCDPTHSDAESFLAQYRTVHTHRPRPHHGPPSDADEAAEEVLRLICQLRNSYGPTRGPRTPHIDVEALPGFKGSLQHCLVGGSVGVR